MDIVDIAVEAIKEAGLIAPKQIVRDRFTDRVKTTSLLVAETESKYNDAFSSPSEYGIYDSTLQIVAVSDQRNPGEAQRLCREATETVIRRFDQMTVPYTGPVHGVRRIGKEQGTPEDTNCSDSYASIRTILVIHQFEP